MNEQQNNESSSRPGVTGNVEGVQQISIPVTNASGSPSQPGANVYINDVKSFFSKSLLQIIKDIFSQPIKGTLGIFTNAGSEAYQQGLILIITTVVFYILVPYIMAGSEIRSAIGFGAFFKLGLSAGLVLVIISALTFVVKAVSGKPDFKKELLTGGICGIPLMLILLTIAIFMMFNKDSMSLLNPESLIQQGIFSGIIMLYFLLMLFNIIQQSFKASGTNDALSWYLSPLVICIGFYIGVKIASSLFMPSLGGYGNGLGY
jgi:hypothetical protein